MPNKSSFTQQFGARLGAYEPLIRASKQVLDASDRVQFEVYVSGYGVVESASIYIVPSWSVFSVDDSRIAVADLPPQPWELLGELVSFDNKAFFDATGRYQISTECKTPPPGAKAPVTLDMKIDPEAVPGVYALNCVLKYYNGESWNTKSAYVNFTLRNFYQRHELFAWVVGVIAAASTIISAVSDTFPFIKWLCAKLLGCFWR